MTSPANDRPTYTDPNALSLDGACEATGIATTTTCRGPGRTVGGRRGRRTHEPV
jgi:hypothetical protein